MASRRAKLCSMPWWWWWRRCYVGAADTSWCRQQILCFVCCDEWVVLCSGFYFGGGLTVGSCGQLFANLDIVYAQLFRNNVSSCHAKTELMLTVTVDYLLSIWEGICPSHWLAQEVFGNDQKYGQSLWFQVLASHDLRMVHAIGMDSTNQPDNN